MKTLLLALALTLGRGASAGTVTSTEPLHCEFDLVARLYYRVHEHCNKPNRKMIPSQRAIKLTLDAYTYSATRWWPECVEQAEYNLLALAHTEGGGSPRGVKADPDVPRYGPLHVGYQEARYVGALYNLSYMYRNEEWFRSTLKGNPNVAVYYGAAFLYVCYIKTGRDWDRAVLMYKYGEGGYTRFVASNLTSHPPKVLRKFKNTLHWIMRIRDHVQRGEEVVKGCPCVYEDVHAKESGRG